MWHLISIKDYMLPRFEPTSLKNNLKGGYVTKFCDSALKHN